MNSVTDGGLPLSTLATSKRSYLDVLNYSACVSRTAFVRVMIPIEFGERINRVTKLRRIDHDHNHKCYLRLHDYLRQYSTLMPNIFYPYTIGENSPISYLFEKISPHVANSGHKITIFTNRRNYHDRENITEIFAYNSGSIKRKVMYLYGSLSSYDLIHTGGFAKRHNLIRKILMFRNESIRNVHTFRIDVDPDMWTSDRRQLVESADALTAVSESTAKTVEQVHGEKPNVIYNGVDTDVFHTSYDSPKIYDDLGEDVFVYVGSFHDRKRPYDVVEVAKRVPEADFAMFGDGPLLERIQKKAEDMDNLNVYGRVPKSSLPAIYSNSIGLLFPSIREGCPNVVLESLASGTPVIGYRSTSMPELVAERKTGLLAEPKNVEMLSEETKTILSDDHRSMESRCREYVKENHSFDEIASQYVSVYNSVLD